MNAEVQKLCVSFDRYMKIETGVVAVFCILMIVLWSTVNMDLCTQILDFCERNPKFVCINPYLLYYTIQSLEYKIQLQHLSQFSCIYQNIHIIFVLLHSQKSKICVHKSIFTLLHNTIIRIQNTSTTPFSIFMYLSKLTHNFCTSAFTEIQNLCP